MKSEVAFEALEPRRLFSAALHGDLWTIRGDEVRGAWNDSIVVSTHPDDSALLLATISSRSTGEMISQYTQPIDAVGRVRILGGRGDDFIVVNLGAETAINAFIHGGRGSDRLTGGAGDDILIGSRGHDILFGGGGDDRIGGGPGNDRIDGGAGNDLMVGGPGADTLTGGDGDDRLIGSGGHDSLSGEAGADILLGGAGRDVLRGGTGPDAMVGGAGRDTLFGSVGLDFIRGARRDIIKPDLAAELAATEYTFSSGVGLEAMIDAAVATYGDWFTMEPRDVNPLGGFYGGRLVAFDTNFDFATTNMSLAVGSYSQTNTQEAGVDEGDIVETDGEYIYTLAGGNLVILDAWPADELSVISETNIEGEAMAMYLDGDRVTVISRPQGSWYSSMRLSSLWYGVQPHDAWVKVTVFDISAAAAPQVVEETVIDGRYVDSRSTDGQLYLVVANNVSIREPIWVYDEAIGKYVIEDEQAYRERLAEDLPDEMPRYTTTGAADAAETVDIIDASMVYYPGGCYDGSIMSVMSLNTRDDEAGPSATTSVVGMQGQVYATAESLYIAGPKTAHILDNGMLRVWNTSQGTSMHKFDLTDPEMPLVATGHVDGTLLDQFSMDEHDGTIRIATTDRSDGQWSNSVFVLSQTGDALNVVGSITDLAPTESIYAARFMGDTAYVVTYRLVDPLYTIDLSDPTNPTVVGELKIPGYSTYLHPMGENHLIGFGRAAEGGRYAEMQLSLFNVSDPANPLRTDLYSFGGGRGGQSVALADHHGFSYFPEFDILAIPVADGYMDGDSAGVAVFRVTVEEGFEYLGLVNHTNAGLRSLRIGDYLYSLSSGAVKVTELTDPATILAEAEIPVTTQGGYIMLPPIFPGPVIGMPFMPLVDVTLAGLVLRMDA